MRDPASPGDHDGAEGVQQLQRGHRHHVGDELGFCAPTSPKNQRCELPLSLMHLYLKQC